LRLEGLVLRQLEVVSANRKLADYFSVARRFTLWLERGPRDFE
jgi:hypothetical protein